MDRRRFLSSAAATTAYAGAAAAREQVEPEPLPEVIRIGAPERPRCDIESWNLELITAYRPGLAPAETEARNRELLTDLTHFGRYQVRGRYVENYGSANARPIDVKAYLVIGNSDDSGNLKGALRKLGRKYEQDAVIHKGYYRDAELHALKDVLDLAISDKEKKGLGKFHPSRLGLYFTLMTSRAASPLPVSIEELRLGPNDVDWLGGRWEDIGIWTPRSFFSRCERRVYFDDAGNRRGT
jgi:hypothetical protein